MVDTLQYRRVIGIQYTIGKGEIILNMEGTKDNYYSNADEIQVNIKKIDLENCELEKEAVSLNFSKPITCNITSGKYHSTMQCGTNFEGKEPFKYVERLEDLSDKLDFFKDDSVRKKKEEIQSKEINEKI